MHILIMMMVLFLADIVGELLSLSMPHGHTILTLSPVSACGCAVGHVGGGVNDPSR